MTIAEKFREEGHQRGRMEGMQLGEKKGRMVGEHEAPPGNCPHDAAKRY